MAPAKLQRRFWGGICKRQPSHCTTLSLLDDAFVPERTDALEIVGSGPPSFGGLARGACEATVVVGQESAQDRVGRVDVASLGQAEFAGEAILQHAPEAFDAAFGLGRLRGDEGNAQLSQGAAELSGLALVGEFFFNGPAVVVANEDAAAIPVESRGHTEAIEQAPEQAEVACGGFRRKELGGQDLAGGVVLHAQNGEARATALEPIEQEGFSLSRETLRRLLRSQGLGSPRKRRPPAHRQRRLRVAREGQLVQFDGSPHDELFAKVMVVEAVIASASQLHDAIPYALRDAAVAGPPAAGVCQSCCAALPIAGFEALDMPRRNREQLRGSGPRLASLHALGNDFPSLQFLLTQRDCLLSHGVTFHVAVKV